MNRTLLVHLTIFCAAGCAAETRPDSVQPDVEPAIAHLELVGDSRGESGNVRVGNDASSLPAFDLCAFSGTLPGPGLDRSVTHVEPGAPLLRARLGIARGLRSGQISAWFAIPEGPDSGVLLVDPATEDCAEAVLLETPPSARGLVAVGGRARPIPMTPGTRTLVLFAPDDTLFTTTDDPESVELGEFPYR